MAYSLSETVNAIALMRGLKTSRDAEYMYHKAAERDGITGDELLVVQFFYYHDNALPTDLPEFVRETVLKLRCQHLRPSNGVQANRDHNLRRYWWHLRRNCSGNRLYEYIQLLAIEARVAGYVVSRKPGHTLSFIASQLTDVDTLSGLADKTRVLQMLHELAVRAGSAYIDINARANTIVAFYNDMITRIDHNAANPSRRFTKFRRNYIPDAWPPETTNV